MSNLLPQGNYYTNYSNSVVGPTPINPWSALAIPAFKRAVQFLSDNLASFDFSIRQNDNPVTPAHPLEKLLCRRPNNYQNANAFWSCLYGHMTSRGNGYAQIERGPAGKPIALNNILPDELTAVRVQYPDSSVEQFYVHMRTKQILPGNEIVHLKYGVSNDGMVGIDPVCLHERTYQRASTLDQYQTKYLQKGTNLRGVIKFPKGVTKEQVEEIQGILGMFFRGPDAENDILTLSDGGDFQNVTVSPKDSELSLQESSVTKQIAQIMGIHPALLFDDPQGKYNASGETAGEDIVRFTFRTIIEQIEAELSFKLLTETEQDLGYEVELDPCGLIRGDFKTINEIAESSTNAGLRTRNEGRTLIGLPPDKDPESDKLKALGDTGAPPTPSEKANKSLPAPQLPADDTQYSAKNPLALMAPIITAACQRVDQKTEKAFASHSKKTGPELTIWGNVFSSEQQKYVVDALQPVADSIKAMGAAPFDVEKAAERYSSAVRKRAATGEVVTLDSIMKEIA